MTEKQATEADEFDSPGWYIKETISRAKDGDRNAALELLDAASCGLFARSLDMHVADYLAACLMTAHKSLIAADAKPGEVLVSAFNLGREARRPTVEKTIGRSMDIAVWVCMAQDECGMSFSEAKAAASSLFAITNIARELRAAGEVKSYDATLYRERFQDMKRPLPPRR